MVVVSEEFPNKETGDKVQQARNAKGYTTTQLGDRIGVSHVTILNVEKGKEVSNNILIALGRELDSHFDVTWLQEHQRKYASNRLSFNEIIGNEIRQQVRDEIHSAANDSKHFVQTSNVDFFGQLEFIFHQILDITDSTGIKYKGIEAEKIDKGLDLLQQATIPPADFFEFFIKLTKANPHWIFTGEGHKWILLDNPASGKPEIYMRVVKSYLAALENELLFIEKLYSYIDRRKEFPRFARNSESLEKKSSVGIMSGEITIAEENKKRKAK